jgi:hypothetical protein
MHPAAGIGGSRRALAWSACGLVAVLMLIAAALTLRLRGQAGSSWGAGGASRSMASGVSPSAGALAAPRRVAVSGVEAFADALHVEVRFESDVPAPFTLEVAPIERAEPTAITTRETEARTTHRMRVAGLTPGTRHRLSLIGPGGREVHSFEAWTLPFAELATSLERALGAMAPLSLARRLIEEARPLARPTHVPPGHAARWAEFRKCWGQTIADAARRSRVADLSSSFAPLRDQVHASGGVPGETKRKLYEHLDQLQDLEEAAREASIEVPPRAVSLTSSGYSQIPASRLAARVGDAVIIDSTEGHVGHEIGPGIKIKSFRIPGRAGDMVEGTEDPRFGAIEADFSSRARPSFELPETLDLAGFPPGGPVELHATLEAKSAHAAVRVYFAQPAAGGQTPSRASSPGAAGQRGPRSSWNLLARLRIRHEGRHRVIHTIPPGVLPRGPLLIKIELAYSEALAMFQRQITQKCRVKWLMLVRAPG